MSRSTIICGCNMKKKHRKKKGFAQPTRAVLANVCGRHYIYFCKECANYYAEPARPSMPGDEFESRISWKGILQHPPATVPQDVQVRSE